MDHIKKPKQIKLKGDAMNIKEQMIDVYLSTKDTRVLSDLIDTYGVNVLLEMDEVGLDILARNLINPEKNDYFLYILNNIKFNDFRRILEKLTGIYELERDELRFNVIDFISTYPFTLEKRMNNEFLSFILNIVNIERHVQKETDFGYIDEVLESFLLENPTTKKESIFHISTFIPEVYTYLMKYIYKFYSIYQLSDFIYAIDDIRSRLENTFNDDTLNTDIFYQTIFLKDTNISDSIRYFIMTTLENVVFDINNPYFFKEFPDILLSTVVYDRSLITHNDYYIQIMKILFKKINEYKKEVEDEYFEYASYENRIPYQEIVINLELCSLKGLVYAMFFRDILNKYSIINDRASFSHTQDRINNFLFVMEMSGIKIEFE